MNKIIWALVILNLVGCNEDLQQALTGADRKCPSSDLVPEQAINIVNEVRSNSRMCGDEYFEATEPVVWNDLLETVAKSHSNDMAHYNFFSHTGSNGLSASYRLTNAGYDWKTYGENISGGRESLQSTIEGLVNSPGHCANIMNPSFREMGMACSDKGSSELQVYWTQVFSTPK